jgi:hypothetical protein
MESEPGTMPGTRAAAGRDARQTSTFPFTADKDDIHCKCRHVATLVERASGFIFDGVEKAGQQLDAGFGELAGVF